MADLTVKIVGDGSSAINELEQVKRAATDAGETMAKAGRKSGDAFEYAAGQLRNTYNDATRLNGAFDGFAGSAEESFRRLGKSAQNESRIAREAFVTGTSEIIESWGVDGDIANEIGAMLAGLPPQAKVAVVGIAAAFIAAAAAVAAIIATTKQAIDLAGELATKNKDEYDKLVKNFKSVNVEVTQLDRTLSGGITREVERLKAASDGLFLQVVRNSGPALIVLLRETTALLIQMQPTAQVVGNIIAGSFIIAAAGIRTARKEADDLLLAFAVAGPAGAAFRAYFGRADGQAKSFGQNVADVTAEIVKLNTELGKQKPLGFTSEQKKADIQSQIALLKVYEQQTQRIANEELAAAKRLYEAKGINAEQYAAKQIEIEQRVLAAKLATIDAEADLIGKDGETALQAQAKRAQLQEQALQLLYDYREKSKQIRDAQLREEADAITRTLDNARKIAQERLRLAQELQQIGFDIRAIRLDTQDINLQRDQANPGNEATELARAQALAEAQARLQSERTQAQIQAQRNELEFADLTYQEKLRLEQAFNAQLIAERQRLGNELAALAVASRATELQTQGFGQAQSTAIAEFEASIERQATLWEKTTVAAQAYARVLAVDVKKAAGQAKDVLGNVTNAVVAGVNAFIQSGGSIKAAGKAFAQALAAPYIEFAKTKALYHAAEAIASLAILDFRGAALHGLAAAGFAALAGVGTALVNGIGGGGGAQQGGLSQQLTGTNQQTTTEERQRFIDGQGIARANTNVTITLVSDQTQIVKNVEYGLSQSYRNDGTARRVIQAETQGTALDS
jgi:uncharacterized protein (UPF0335 family)